MTRRIQNADVKAASDLGGDETLLTHATKIYSPTTGKTIEQSIIDGDLAGGGGSNEAYYFNDFESDDGNFVAYDQVGDVSTFLSVSQSASDPLRGDYSLLISKTANDANLHSVSNFENPITFDKAALTKVVIISFNYETSGAYETGDLELFIQDQTGYIPQIANKAIQAGSGTHYARMQVGYNDSPYEFYFYVRSTNSGAWTIKVDNLKIAEQQLAYGPIMIDPQPLSLSFSSTYNFSGYTASYQRFGSKAYISFNGTMSATGTGNIVITLGSGLVPVSGVRATGVAVAADVNVTDNVFTGTLGLNGTNFILYGNNFNTWSATKPFTWAIGDILRFEGWVDIVGWSSNAQISQDFGGQPAKLINVVSGTQSFTSGTAQQVTLFGVPQEDSVAGWDNVNKRYYVKKGGFYTLHAKCTFNVNSTGARWIYYSINGGVVQYLNGAAAASGTQTAPSGSALLNLSEGDYIEIHAYQSSGAALNLLGAGFYLSDCQGGQSLFETELVYGRYTSNSGQSVANNTQEVIEYEDIDFQTHNMLNLSTYAVDLPYDGVYLVTASFRMLQDLVSEAALIGLSVRLNGVIVKGHYNCSGITGGANRYHGRIVTALVRGKQGDAVDIAAFQNSGASKNLEASGAVNVFEITKIK